MDKTMAQCETDLVAYIMGLWDQEKRFKMVQNYNGAIKLKHKDLRK